LVPLAARCGRCTRARASSPPTTTTTACSRAASERKAAAPRRRPARTRATSATSWTSATTSIPTRPLACRTTATSGPSPTTSPRRAKFWLDGTVLFSPFISLFIGEGSVVPRRSLVSANRDNTIQLSLPSCDSVSRTTQAGMKPVDSATHLIMLRAGEGVRL
jgi:hypothetical protein